MQRNQMPIDVTPATEQVLDVLVEGRATPGMIADETGLSRNTVHNQLRSLRAGDYIQYAHKGTAVYELVEDPRESAES